MTTHLTLYNATTITGDVVDVRCDQSTGLIESVLPSTGSYVPGSGDLDLSGYLLSCGFVEPHAHLDKAFLADRVDNPEGDLMGAILGLEAIRHSITFDDIVERAIRAAVALSRNGVTTIRTHADVTVSGGLTPLLALLEARRRCQGFIKIDVAMLLEWPLTGPGSTQRHALARDAISAGAQVIGGCPHLDDDPAGAIEFLLSLAHEHQLPLDLHADENLRPTSDDLFMLAEMAVRSSSSVPMNASHCVSLSMKDSTEVQKIAEKVATARISVTVLPQTNLFLQDRQSLVKTHRAIAPITLLQQAGVLVAAGADNVQDPFNPVGRLDPLETASLLVMAGHQSTRNSFAMISSHAIGAITGKSGIIAAGEPADLVAVVGTCERDVIANAPSGRIVIKNGSLVTTDQYLSALHGS